MRYLLPLIALLILTISTSAISQNSIPASEIIKKIERGESVSYNNAIITGDLDLTFYFEKKNEIEHSKKRSLWNDWDNTVEEIIDSRITFTNCTFKDGVFAYIHDEHTKYTFIASFDEAVVFKNCVFEEESEFKYSKFRRQVDFSGTVFNQEALFKYAKFQEYVDFGGTVFQDDANFKYTKFQDGLNLSNSVFKDDLNLKYAKIDGEFNTDNMDIQDDIDVKYTKVNGENFSKFLLKSK